MIRLDVPLWVAASLLFGLGFLPAVGIVFVLGVLWSGKVCP